MSTHSIHVFGHQKISKLLNLFTVNFKAKVSKINLQLIRARLTLNQFIIIDI